MITTLAIVAILLLITGLVYGYVRDALNAPMGSLASTDYNATVANIDSNVYASLDLASVTPIVIAAITVIAVVMLLRMG